MTLPKHLLLAASCLCQALTILSPAHAQTGLPAAKEGRDASPAPVTAKGEASAYQEDWYSQEFAFDSFIRRVWAEELSESQPTREDMVPPIHSDYAKILGIREDEEQVMRSIAFDGGRRLAQMSDDCVNAHSDTNFRGPDYLAKVGAVCSEGPKIVFETIAKLKLELGRDDFKKLDTYVYQTGRQRNPAPAPQELPSPSTPTQSAAPCENEVSQAKTRAPRFVGVPDLRHPPASSTAETAFLASPSV